MEFDEIKLTEETEFEGEATSEFKKKNVHVPALVLMIVGAVFSILLPPVTFVCSTISLVFATIKRRTYRTKVTFIIDIVALIVATINTIIGVIIFSKMKK